jgi:AcrR family transcriptional regulator
MSENKITAVDGRRLRSERTRLAIIDAAVALQEEGVLIPTAQQISDRAGVLIRSFFRHFEDMESLFKVADDHIRESYESLFRGGDRTGTLAQRIDSAVAHRAYAFERVTNMMLGTKAQLWRYEMLRKNYARNQRALRKDIVDWLPELGALPKPAQEAVDAVTSFEMWHRLRSEQGLAPDDSAQIITSLLNHLILCDLSDDPPSH